MCPRAVLHRIHSDHPPLIGFEHVCLRLTIIPVRLSMSNSKVDNHSGKVVNVQLKG